MMKDILINLNHALWAGPMLFLLLGTHLFFTIRLRFVQKHIRKAIRLSFTPSQTSSAIPQTDSPINRKPQVGPFRMLATTLAATLGTGNIIGISAAIALGGAGAVFWCWLTGVFGMATTYAECFLGTVFRRCDSDGHHIGGPIAAIRYGLGMPFFAKLYAVLFILAGYGMASTTANALRQVSLSLISGLTKAVSFPLPLMNQQSLFPCLVGIAFALLLGFVINGGAHTISSVAIRLVPAMFVAYLASCLVLLVINRAFLLDSISLILKSAFGIRSIAGGVLAGSLQTVLRYGIARGLFTNEAGLGSAAIAATDNSELSAEKIALVSMSATFWDTVVMCAITGVVVVSGALRNPVLLAAAGPGDLTMIAFSAFPVVGPVILNCSLTAFAFATLIGWSYLAEKAAVCLFGTRGISPYRLVYILVVYLGFLLSIELVFEFSDLLNFLLIIPNILSLYLLRKQILPVKMAQKHH